MNSTLSLVSCIAFLFVLFAIVLLSMGLKIVREYQRLVVFRLGKCVGQRGPGLVILIPFIENASWVDLREQFLEVPHQTTITKDNASISVDFLIFWKVVDPIASVVQVGNFAAASQGIATTTLRAVIGDIMLDDVLAQREHINSVLRQKLDEVTERWGNKVTAVGNSRDLAAARDPRGHDAPDVGRAHPPRGGYRGGRQEAGDGDRGGRGQAVGDLARGR